MPVRVVPRAEEEQVRASHILVKHKGSRRPSSWKTVSSGAAVTCVCGWGSESTNALLVCGGCCENQEVITITIEEATARLKGTVCVYV